MYQTLQASRFLLVRPALLALALSLTAGCSSGSDGDISPAPTVTPAPVCGVQPLNQPRHRFPVGDTFYLPRTTESTACGTGAVWELTSAPSSNLNAVVLGADGYARFSPHLPGDYTFTLKGTAFSEGFTAIAGETLPFHNLNYYAASSVAEVNGELWTANVYTPSISRIDPSSLKVLGTIPVGAWPVAVGWSAGSSEAVVAQRGSDTLGFIDVAGRRLVDSVWVGDEPSNLVLSPDGHRAYVALATQGAVAVVDLMTHTLEATIPATADPLGLAVSHDGKTVYVACHRSGQPDRYPYESDPVSEERDIAVIDTASSKVTGYFLDVGATLNSLLVSADDARLYVAQTRNNTEPPLTDPEADSFIHEVAVLDAKTGARLAGADLSRQGSSNGPVVSIHGLTLAQGLLWVASEGSDETLGLDPESLEELTRAATPGRPRGVAAVGESIFVHGEQGFVVSRLGSDGKSGGQVTTTEDPRPAQVSQGQRYFTGAGVDFGQTWSCNSCHLDGLTDTLIWNAGPFTDRITSRPIFWTEGTWPLGWAGYLSNIRNYAYTVNVNIGVSAPTSDQVNHLWAYLASIMPPPTANGWTERDGSLSEQALRGKALYDGKAACASCHPMPLGTSRATLPEGITSGVSDIPSLVGIYRYNVWLKHGEATTFPTGVKAALDWLGVKLSDDETTDLTRYVSELTARDFFVLTPAPRDRSTSAGVDVPVGLTFSGPVWDDAANLAHIHLKDSSGQEVSSRITVDGRQVTLTPKSRLAFSTSYTLSVDAGLESFDERPLAAAVSYTFTTAAAPSLKLSGDYVWTIHMPSIDFETGTFNPEITVDVPVDVTAASSASGANLLLTYTSILSISYDVVVDGKTLLTPTLPAPAGPSFADSTGMTGTLIDEDKDGVGDRASGTMTISGPGFVQDGVAWELARPPAADECNEGPNGTPALTLTPDDQGRPVVSWTGANAIGYYVTDPQATLPTGPNSTVRNGNTYWAVEAVDFKAGFGSPVIYQVLPDGAADVTVKEGGTAGGVPLEAGKCYKFSVITTSFTTGTYTKRW